MQKLSIAIPTYNRRKQLQNQLNSLFKQDLSKVEDIIVIDNHSNYNIKELLDTYNSKKIRLIINPINIGMSTNLQSPFLYCKTEWLWLLSDDDETLDNSIEKINEKIEKATNNTGLIKFSLLNKNSTQSSKKINKLTEFIDYYYNEKPIRKGEIIFMSTNVFNVNVLKDYLIYSFSYSYSYVGFIVPVFVALDDEKISVNFVSDQIVEYIPPRDEGYRLDDVGKGFSILSYLNLKLNRSYLKKFMEIMTPISYFQIFKFLLSNSDRNNPKTFNIIYSNSFKYYLNIFEKILCKLLEVSLHLKITYILFRKLKYILKK